MKINTKHIGLCLLLGAAMSTTSCNDLLDLDPVSQITPESFYTSADQLATLSSGNAQLGILPVI